VIEIKGHLGVDVGRADLANEPMTAATGRQHIEEALLVAPHSDDLVDPIFAG